MFCPALSARNPAAWIAGPSAIGSVNGMPSSITSAPACGSALRIASEVVVIRIARHGEGHERGAALLLERGKAAVDAGRHRIPRVIAGRREAASPKSICTDRDYGFRAPRCARPRNDE